ncbi:unnamed protein product [Effrenium voratum]|nr:unnamed protein product [Effrenium voratum]
MKVALEQGYGHLLMRFTKKLSAVQSTKVMAGKVINAALQALLLLVVGNAGAIRQLSGNFYAYHMNKLLDLGEEFLGAAANKVQEKKEKQDERRGLERTEDSDGESDNSKGSKGPRMRKKLGQVEVPQGQERRVMSSLQSLSLKCQVLVDALRGHAARDRPAIVTKACRLFLLILEHHRGLIMKANDQGENQSRRVELMLKKGAPKEDLQFEEVFHHLASIKAALISTLRTHNENSPVISAVFSVMAKLREIALLSVPAGMHLCGSNAEKQWQAALLTAGGEDTELVLRQAAKRLHTALEETKKGDHRIETLGALPQELRGNGEWLTPRMRQEVQTNLQVGEVLAADAFRANWAQQEEPDRWDKIYKRQQQLAAQQKYREDKKKAKELGISYEEFHRLELEEQAKRDAADSDSSSAMSFAKEEPGGSKEEEEEEELLNWDEEDVHGHVEWLRAIGFGSHDEEDFGQLWRQPIRDAFMRMLPGPAPADSYWALEAAAKRRELVEQAERTGEPLEDPDMDTLLQIEMLESVQGKLKIRALVRPQDKIQANNIEERVGRLSGAMGQLGVAELGAEFLGTFVLAFTVGCNLFAGTALVHQAISVACALLAMMYVFGSISGGHLNPSVSFAMLCAGKMRPLAALAYGLVQIGAGVVALLAASHLFEASQVLSPEDGHSWMQACAVELVYTLMLDLVILCVFSRRNNPDSEPNQFYGLAAACALAAGLGSKRISGGVFNPAIAIGLGVASSKQPFTVRATAVLMYVVYQLFAGALAALLFRVLRPEEYMTESDRKAYAPSRQVRAGSEFVGTMLLTATARMCGNAWAPGLALVSLVYALGDLSGGHFNPAVTAAVVLSRTRRFTTGDLLGYWASQVLAAILGALLCSTAIVGDDQPMGPKPPYQSGAAYIVEFMFTLILCHTVLAVACIKGIATSFSRNYYFGLAVGFALVSGGFACFTISGACFNPAISVGVALVSLVKGRAGITSSYYAINYCLAQLLGGITSALLFRSTHAREYTAKSRSPFGTAF